MSNTTPTRWYADIRVGCMAIYPESERHVAQGLDRTAHGRTIIAWENGERHLPGCSMPCVSDEQAARFRGIVDRHNAEIAEAEIAAADARKVAELAPTPTPDPFDLSRELVVVHRSCTGFIVYPAGSNRGTYYEREGYTARSILSRAGAVQSVRDGDYTIAESVPTARIAIGLDKPEKAYVKSTGSCVIENCTLSEPTPDITPPRTLTPADCEAVAVRVVELLSDALLTVAPTRKAVLS